MTACPVFQQLLILPHLRVQNANAISSPLTHGFPSITAFLGLMWALQRKTRRAGLDLTFHAVGVICHDYQEQITTGGFVKTFHLKRHPVGKDGGSAAIVEEGRIHLELSLVFAISSQRWRTEADTELQQRELALIASILAGMRVAGGSLLPPEQPWRPRYQPLSVDLSGTEEDRAALFRKLRLRLLPGFALVARDDLLEARLLELRAKEPATSSLDAWLSLARINWRHSGTSEHERTKTALWENDRKGAGWIVPMPVGYGALGELQAPGQVAHTRDVSSPFRFVESFYSVGEWVSPHRLYLPQQLLWYADSQPDRGCYRCRNDYRALTQNGDFVVDID